MSFENGVKTIQQRKQSLNFQLMGQGKLKICIQKN